MESSQAARSDEAPSNIHAPRHHRNPGWKVKGRVKLAYRHHHIRRDHASRATPPLMHAMKYMVASVLVVVTLKYQTSLFQENPAPVWCFLAAICVYWLTVGGAMKQMTAVDGRCLQTLSNAALASGIFSAISLVSIFLPYPVSLLPITILISLPVVFALRYAYNLFNRGIESAIKKMHTMLVWARGCNLEASSPV